MIDNMLVELAAKCGVSPIWTDLTGTEKQVSADTLRAILAALGLPTDSEAAIRNSMSMMESAIHVAAPSRFTTARVGQPVSLPVVMEEGTRIEIELDAAGTRIVTAQLGFDGRLALPPFEEPGYHVVRLPDGDYTVATAPVRCMTFADFSGGAEGWGLAAQIYSLRSPDDGGIGNFTGVSALARAAAAQGADALAISPSHALFGAEPRHFSPYSPSTRLFYNPLHADPANTFSVSLIAQIVAQLGLGEQLAQLEASPMVDWNAATPLRHKILRALFIALRSPAFSQEPILMEFNRALADATPLLRAHAVFEALHAHQLTTRGVWHWTDWHIPFRNPDSAEVAAFADEHEEDVAYQIFLQWLTGRAYGEAQRTCRESGMRVGLIADLAIGMDGAGSHAWSRQRDVLNGLSVGAPPDYYVAEGQNWGLTTFSPHGLALSGFAPFIETLRANLRYAGGLRIDHVMGLSRLWLVPDGAVATQGAYVTFPSETMFRLIALESHRHKAIIIGEDLGTLPNGFHEYMEHQGVAGMRVLRFEKSVHGYIAPRDWDPASVALTTTHDLMSTAGWWAGADLDADASEDVRAVRNWDRGVLWGALVEQGLVQGERPSPEHPATVVDAAIGYVAASPCTLKIVAMEDIIGLQVQPNKPGTTTEKPNWQHRLEGQAGDLLGSESAQARLRMLGLPRNGLPDTAA